MAEERRRPRAGKWRRLWRLRLRAASLRQRLVLLVLAAVLPLAGFSMVAIVLLAHSKQDEYERSLMETVRALSSAVDNELLRSAAVIEATALASDDIGPLYALSKEILERQPGWLAVVLATPDGRYLFNTSRPLGSNLPEFVRNREDILSTAGDGRATVGQLLVGRVAGVAVFTASAPVIQDRVVRYVLTAAISPDSILHVLQRQKVPPEATIAVLDQNRTVVARSRQHHKFVGSAATADLQAIMHDRPEGVGYPKTLEGVQTYAAFSTSSRTGWSVVIGLPWSSVRAPLRDAYLTLAVGLAVSALLAGLAAMTILRSILGPIQGLHASARSIVAGEVAPVADTDVAELREVSEALAHASRSLRESAGLRELLLQQEQEARQAAEQASRDKDQFIAMLSHELRNPLAVIGNASELLQRSALPPSAGKWTDAIRRQVRHLSYLINDLLDVSRASTGKMSIRHERVDLAECVKEALRVLHDSGAAAAHSLEVDLRSTPVIGDRDRLQQVASNLVGNAFKYSPPGSAVKVAVRAGNEGAMLEVTDRGIGMDAETAGHVFDLFFQKQPSPAHGQGGLGVGLTLVRRIVELHGGRIAARSPGPGQGSTFTVWLPRVDAAS